jgi:hypothetical protein
MPSICCWICPQTLCQSKNQSGPFENRVAHLSCMSWNPISSGCCCHQLIWATQIQIRFILKLVKACRAQV